jgi:hypothetical protein
MQLIYDLQGTIYDLERSINDKGVYCSQYQGGFNSVLVFDEDSGSICHRGTSAYKTTCKIAQVEASVGA